MADKPGVLGLLERLRVVQLWLAAVSLVVMMGVTIADVFLRYLFNSPVHGAYDLVESCLVVFVFHGMSTAFLQRRSIVIDLIDSFAPARLVAVLVRLADLLAILTLAFFAYAMITPALQAYAYGDLKIELRLPVYILWVVALTGMAGSILCAFGTLFLPAVGRHSESFE